MNTKLVLATHNQHKAEELRAMLAGLTIEVLTLDDFPQVGEIDEDGETLEENALKKARTVHAATSLPSLADDTGLEVYYLNGQPGVYSARYAGPGATYSDNVKKLLKTMRGVPQRRRGARFLSVLAFVAPETTRLVQGVCRGAILEQPRGSGGFGYDPVFLPNGYDKTFAEMDAGIKNSISHRGQAFHQMKSVLEEYFAMRGR